MTHVRLFVAALALSCAAPSLAVAQTDLTGDWVLTVTSPQGTRDLNAKFKQDGEKLTGTLMTPRGETVLDVTITGADVKIAWKAEVQGQPFPITLTGKLENGTMKGKADYAGMAEGEWSAKRGTVAPPATTTAPPATTSTPDAAAAAPSVEVGGDWDITLKTMTGEFPAKATLKQDGGKVTGMVGNQMGQQPLNGTIEGKTLKFSFVTKTANGDIPVTLSGDVDGDTVVGKAEIGGMTGEWTAKRAKPQ